jgi:hypothetical protein
VALFDLTRIDVCFCVLLIADGYDLVGACVLISAELKKEMVCNSCDARLGLPGMPGMPGMPNMPGGEQCSVM